MAISQNQNQTTKRLGTSPGRFAVLLAIMVIFLSFHESKAECTSYPVGNFSFLPALTSLLDSTAQQDSLMLPGSSPTDGIDSSAAALDSAEAELDAFEAELDAMETDTLEPKWSLSMGTKYLTQEQRNGVDISNGLPTFGSTFSISHDIGLELSISTSHIINKKKLEFQNYAFGLSYVYSAADWVDLTLGFSRTKYQTDTSNALAGSSLVLSFMADFYIKRLILDLSIDRYTGDDASTALTLSTIYPLSYGDLTITPMFGISLLSYEISTKRLKATAKTTTKTKKALSLSSVLISVPMSYPIYKGFSLIFTPTFSYSPIETVSSNRTQLVANAGIRYSLDF